MKLDIKVLDVAIARDGLELEKALEAGEGTGYDVHRVTVFHADQVFAEREARKYGIAGLSEDPIASMTLWCWVALKRHDAQIAPFPLWKNRSMDVQEVTDDPDAEAAGDPTVPEVDTPWP